jgi:ABC-type multidrug transport system fused ATPase/permease subunit
MNLSQGAVALFNLLAFVLTALALNAPAALTVAAAACLLALMLRPVRIFAWHRSRRSAEANLAFATAVTELAATTQEVRIFEVERQVGRRLETMIDTTTVRQFQSRVLTGLSPALYQAVAMLLVVGALGIAYAAGESEFASLGAVVLLMLRSLTYGQTVQISLQGLHESAPYLETLQDQDARYRAAAIDRRGKTMARIGELAFESVSFEYEPGRPVLHDLTFQVPRGEIVGIVGPSGAGKSTLVQLILRLRHPSSGRILADSRDVTGFSLDDWYHHVTFVPQDARFFAGTVGENIRFFRDGIEDSAVERAARRAHLHDEIISWPMGYDTPVGERGGQLSGGQRQRLCIARALVDEPQLVVLDEPTSALDGKSEALMRETMAALAPRTTVFVVAHRLSTLSICHRIMVIHGGELQSFDEPGRLEHDNPFYGEVLRLSGMK